jgi:hypothetical protein
MGSGAWFRRCVVDLAPHAAARRRKHPHRGRVGRLARLATTRLQSARGRHATELRAPRCEPHTARLSRLRPRSHARRLGDRARRPTWSRHARRATVDRCTSGRHFVAAADRTAQPGVSVLPFPGIQPGNHRTSRRTTACATRVPICTAHAPTPTSPRAWIDSNCLPDDRRAQRPRLTWGVCRTHFMRNLLTRYQSRADPRLVGVVPSPLDEQSAGVPRPDLVIPPLVEASPDCASSSGGAAPAPPCRRCSQRSWMSSAAVVWVR